MVSLRNSAARFEIPLTVIEGGSGSFTGVITETGQDSYRSNVFTEPRRVLRVRTPTIIRPGLVVRSPAGDVFIVGDNGNSEVPEGELWNSFKLFKATGQVAWFRRGVRNDPVTLLEVEGPPEDMGLIWATIEASSRETVERKLHLSLEEATFIVGADVQRDDTLDGRPVIRSDELLGIRIGVLR